MKSRKYLWNVETRRGPVQADAARIARFAVCLQFDYNRVDEP